MLDAELKAQAKALGLDANVRFLGFRKDILSMYGQVNVFALSSLSEGLPNVILESMAIGLPVVATRVGGLPEIIDDGRTGILVEPRAHSALAAGIVRLLRDGEFSREVARQAREDVYHRFSPDVQTERLLDVYRKAINA
jgi:glycosyltransferase involved in cell wall biosynthesis